MKIVFKYFSFVFLSLMFVSISIAQELEEKEDILGFYPELVVVLISLFLIFSFYKMLKGDLGGLIRKSFLLNLLASVSIFFGFFVLMIGEILDKEEFFIIELLFETFVIISLLLFLKSSLVLYEFMKSPIKSKK